MKTLGSGIIAVVTEIVGSFRSQLEKYFSHVTYDATWWTPHRRRTIARLQITYSDMSNNGWVVFWFYETHVHMRIQYGDTVIPYTDPDFSIDKLTQIILDEVPHRSSVKLEMTYLRSL